MSDAISTSRSHSITISQHTASSMQSLLTSPSPSFLSLPFFPIPSLLSFPSPAFLLPFPSPKTIQLQMELRCGEGQATLGQMVNRGQTFFFWSDERARKYILFSGFKIFSRLDSWFVGWLVGILAIGWLVVRLAIGWLVIGWLVIGW